MLYIKYESSSEGIKPQRKSSSEGYEEREKART